MKTFIAVSALSLLSTSVSAHPALEKRASSINDGVILNYALTLEHLEATFYREGLAKFSEKDFLDAGFTKTFYKNLKEVRYDEKTHVDFLTGALKAAGVKPVEECTYDFGFTTAKGFVGLASVLEGVGVTAYLGAAASIANKAYLTAAGSILTVESRHNAYIRAGLGQSPFPQAFDVPQTFNEVYTLAAPFIKTCPKGNPALPFKSFPALALGAKNPSPIVTGSTITLTSKTKLSAPYGKKIYAAFLAVTGPTYQPVKLSADGKTVTTTVPAGFHGQSYVVLTDCKSGVNDGTTIAGPAIVDIERSNGGY